MGTFSREESLKTIEVIFRDFFLDSSLKVTENTSPLEIEEWDSLAHINLLSSVESAFSVRFTAEEMGQINDVASLLNALETHLKK